SATGCRCTSPAGGCSATSGGARGEVLPEYHTERDRVDRPDLASFLHPRLDEEVRRDRVDAVGTGDGGRLVHVHLRELDPARETGGKLPQRRLDDTTGSTPVRVEVDDDGETGADHLRFEGRIVDADQFLQLGTGHGGGRIEILPCFKDAFRLAVEGAWGRDRRRLYPSGLPRASRRPCWRGSALTVATSRGGARRTRTGSGSRRCSCSRPASLRRFLISSGSSAASRP